MMLFSPSASPTEKGLRSRSRDQRSKKCAAPRPSLRQLTKEMMNYDEFSQLNQKLTLKLTLRLRT